MNDLQIRAALERHWTASTAGDQDAEHEIYHDDAIVVSPIRGVHTRATQRASPSQPAPGQAVGLCRPADCRRG